NLETERYHTTVQKGKRIIETTVKDGKQFDAERLVEFYDRHGLHPSVVQKVASDIGVDFDIPDNFASQLAEIHARSKKEVKEEKHHFDLPKTKLLFYPNPNAREFESTVLSCKNKMLVLAETAFYPEGGGQDCDLGQIVTPTETIKVTNVQKYDDVVVHYVEKDIPVGELVKGVIDWERRLAHQRNHTATHIILGAARKVLGEHVWQAGAKKTADFARLDITHYQKLTFEDLQQIERVANDASLSGIPLERSFMDREEAEKKFGFRLYEGGIPPGKKLRVVRIGEFDVEACAGTHCASTQEVGLIKLLSCERIQDGVERLEFAAGKAALKHIQTRETYLMDSADVLSVRPEQLPKSVNRFFNEWKDRGKEIEKLRQEGTGAAAQSKEVNGVNVIYMQRDLDQKALATLAGSLIKDPNTVAVLVGKTDRVAMLIARSPDVDKLHCGDALKKVAADIGARGGGKADFAQGGGPADLDAEAALEALIKEVEALLS
ncbi:MAG: alanine--tRNA ligase-related protein, partial [Planctomycetota bacterium]